MTFFELDTTCLRKSCVVDLRIGDLTTLAAVNQRNRRRRTVYLAQLILLPQGNEPNAKLKDPENNSCGSFNGHFDLLLRLYVLEERQVKSM